MGEELVTAIAHSLAMSYGSHVNAPRGGKDWKAAEDLLPLIATHDAEVAAKALRDHRRRVVRFMPAGLVDRALVLADLDDYADRVERGE